MSSPSRSGIFAGTVDPHVAAFTESISFDWRLYRFDIAGSKAHAQMLAKVGLLTGDERDQIVSALDEIEQQIAAGQFAFDPALEDIHMHVEQALIDRLGDVGRKLHTGRSRNDQVATDLRLWCRDSIDQLVSALRDLQRTFLRRCDEDKDVILPAYTHLQRAQPVLASHYWLAYCERWERDIGRLLDCRRRANISVLGAAAVAGTSLPIDRHEVARACQMDQVAANSMDASSDRDFLMELANALSLIAIHLSGWADEWILWSTVEFGFLSLPEKFCTGSSIMPQKINPDVLELIRGRSSRAVAATQGLMILLKGLPFAYHRDYQEDKLHVFAAYDSVIDSVRLAIPVVRHSQLRTDVIQLRIEDGFLDATTLMEYLILQGVPQRSAHHLVGQIVRESMDCGRRLSDLSLKELQRFCPSIDESVYQCLGTRKAVAAFRSYGSSAPQEVAAQVQRWKQKLWAE